MKVGLDWVPGTPAADMLRDINNAICKIWEASDWGAFYQKGTITLEVPEAALGYCRSFYIQHNNIAASAGGAELKFIALTQEVGA